MQLKELESIRVVIEEWLSISKPVVASKQNGDDAAVLNYYEADRGKQNMDQIRSLFEAFRTTEHGLTAGRLGDLNVSNESLRNRLKVLFAVSFVLSGLVAWLLSRSIVRTIRNVSGSMELILNTNDNGKSDLTTRIPVHTNDEIGELAMTMNKLLDLQESKSWAQQHIMELGNRLQGESALEAMAEQFVRYTSDVMNVPHSAFYVIPFLQTKNKLKLAAAGGGSGAWRDFRSLSSSVKGWSGYALSISRFVHLTFPVHTFTSHLDWGALVHRICC